MKKILLWLLIASIFVTTGCSYIEHTQGADTKQDSIQKQEDKVSDQDTFQSQEQKDTGKDTIQKQEEKENDQDSIQNQNEKDSQQDSQSQEPETDKDISTLRVHFIDVDQGDSILIESDNKYMLIDAGEKDKSKVVIDYLEEVGVKKIDYVVGTHPHSDHIGGLADVIRHFDIGKIIMPDVIHTTRTFEDVLDAISEKGLKITKARVNDEYNIGDASFLVIAPNKNDYSNLNNYSVGIKLQNGSNSFIFTGDAEVQSENEIINNGIKLDADVLKLGHHGSSTSNSKKFLDAINPDIAVISVGEDNQYGHPHIEVLQDLIDRNIILYRTDKQGSIILESDGRTISSNKDPYIISKADLNSKVDTKPSDKTESSTPTDKTNTDSSQTKDKSSTVKEAHNPKNITVHITKTGSKYHRANCKHLKSDIEVTLEEALSKGLTPCKTCKPPTN